MTRLIETPYEVIRCRLAGLQGARILRPCDVEP